MAKKANAAAGTDMAERPVIVTTAHKGVFFGYATDTDGETIKLRKARLAVYWSADCKGFMGLANGGPTRSGKPANNGTGGPRVLHQTEEVSGPLSLCSRGTLHATLHPTKWQGDKVWLVAMFGEIAWGEDKLGALKRQIVALAWENPE